MISISNTSWQGFETGLLDKSPPKAIFITTGSSSKVASGRRNAVSDE
jgi:hypothetical protein